MDTKEKVKLIRKLASENGITAYDIGNNTSISLTSARNVLEEDDISPRMKTLNIILDYLTNAITGKDDQIELNEEHVLEYKTNSKKEDLKNFKDFKDFKNLKIDDKLDLIYQQNILINEAQEIMANTLGEILLDFSECLVALKIKMKP